MATVLLLALGCRPGAPQPITDARSANGLAYDLVGDGPLVVLNHGSNLDRRMWQGEVAWLAEHYRVLAYDLRGQGASDDASEPFANHRDLLALLDELGADDAALIGLSAGAQVALDEDVEAIRAQGRVIAQRTPGARLIRIEGGGHLLNMTSPEAFRQAVSAFLGEPVW